MMCTKVVFVSCILMLLTASLFGKNKPPKDSTTHRFSHTVELGGTFRVGSENNFTWNDYDHQTVKANDFLIGLHTEFLNIRVSHLYNIQNNMGLGITYGTSAYFHIKDVVALVPLMGAFKIDILKSKKVHPFFAERLGYAFLARDRNKEYTVKVKGIEGGATNELIVGFDFGFCQKVVPELSFGYTFQHMHSKRVYDLANSLAYTSGYIQQSPKQVTEISNGLYHFIYLTACIKF